MNGAQEPPVKSGETYDVSINAVGEKGDGIARVKGFVLFVPGVQQGDFVKIKITKVLAKVGFAEVVQKMERPERVSKYATMNPQEFHSPAEEPTEKFEETDNFGD